MKPSTKARIFNFEIGDSSHNLKRYKTVMNELGIKQDLIEQFEDYQEIYDETVKRQNEEKKDKRLEKGRGR